MKNTLTLDDIGKILDTGKEKLKQNMVFIGVEATPETKGSGRAYHYEYCDLLHLALFFVLQKNGMSRESIAAMLRKRPLAYLAKKDLAWTIN